MMIVTTATVTTIIIVLSGLVIRRLELHYLPTKGFAQSFGQHCFQVSLEASILIYLHGYAYDFALQPLSFAFHLGFVHPLQDVALHQCLPWFSVVFLFHLSPRLCPSTAGCSPPSMPSLVLCLLFSCFTFHLGFVHPLQDVARHQCLP